MTSLSRNSDTVTVNSEQITKTLQSMPHLVQWVEGSKVSLDIALRNIESLTAEEINKRVRLKKPIKSDGWWCSGVQWRDGEPAGNLYGQVRLDNPPTVNKKELRYLTAAGSSVDAIFLAMPDKLYWAKIHADKATPRHWAEGVKKAGAGLTLGFPTIALTGVWNWGKDGELARWVSEWAEPETTHYISFDSDYEEKSSCRAAILEFGRLLIERGCIVYIVTWDKKDKGMDDFIKAEGGDAYKAAVANAVTLAQWEQQFKSRGDTTSDSPAKGKKPPTPREIAQEIAEQYRPHWKYDNEQKAWRTYSGKHWEKMEIGSFETLLMTVVDAKGINYSGDAYLTDVLKLLTKLLRENHWQTWDRTRYINFNNCVLDGDTLETLEHSPGMGFTSYLPYDYKPLTGILSDPLEALRVNCPNISTWMQTAMGGDAKKMFKLLAIAAGCLRFSFHGYQQFVHCIGVPGSGKGTFARTIEKMVGKDNTQPCSLDSLKDGSTMASIIDKQAVIFADERKPVGVDSILRLTGGDKINYRQVYQPAASAPFHGLLFICSNDPIFMGNTTGLERRLCLVEFNNPVPKALRNPKMEASFDSEIASLIAIALSLPSSDVKQAIQGIGDAEIADFKATEWDMKVRMDSLAAFFEMELIVGDGAQVRAGDLFDRYKDFCEEIKKPAMSLTTFSPGLEKLCNELHLPVTRDRSGRHVTFIGLRLRGENDENPTYSQQLRSIAGLDAGVSSTFAGLDAGLPPIQGKDLQDLQDFTSNILEVCEIDQKEIDAAWEEVDIKEVTHSSPASPANPIHSKAASPAQSPVPSPATPPPSPAIIGAKHKEFEVGDLVVIAEINNIYKDMQGRITEKWYVKDGIEYKIELDKKKSNSFTTVVTIPNSPHFPILMKL